MAIIENTFSKVAILEILFKIMSRNRKIGKAKALVIVAGENQTEIHPLWGGLSKNGNSQNGIIRSGDSGKYFPKSGDSGKYFSK